MNPYEVILERLERIERTDYTKMGIVGVFTHLIKLMGEEDFNLNFIGNFDYFDNFDAFYFGFHKQFRQVDMYNFDAAEFIGRKSYEKNKEKWDKRVEEKEGDIRGSYLFFPIGGHLDMIFWHMIHADSEVWDDVLRYTYVKYEHSKQKKTEEV